jgi:hypothetical protein
MVTGGLPTPDELLRQILAQSTPPPVKRRTGRSINDDVEKAMSERIARAQNARTARFANVGTSLIGDAETRLIEAKQKAAEQLQRIDPADFPENQKRSLLDRVFSGLDAPGRIFARPAMGAVLANVFRAMPGEQPGEAQLREAVGTNPLAVFAPDNAQKVREALKETDLPWGVYTAMELALDPLTYVPFGVAGKGIKGLSWVTRKSPIKPPLLKRAPPEARSNKRVAPLMPLAERVDLAMPENAAKRLGESLARIPKIREMLGGMNPTILAKSREGKILIAYAQTLDDAGALAKLSTAGVAAMRMPFVIKDGFTTLKTGKQFEWHTLFEQYNLPKIKKQLTKEQYEWIDEYVATLKEGIAILPRHLRKEIPLAKGEVYIPHKVWGRQGLANVRNNMGKALGAKPSSMRTRYFQKIEDGIEAGYNYLDDPLAVLASHMEGVYRVIADDGLLKQIRPLGRTALDRVNMQLKSTLASTRELLKSQLEIKDWTNKFLQEGVLGVTTIQAIMRRSPILGERVARINKMKAGERKTQLLQKLDSDVNKRIPSLTEKAAKAKQAVDEDIVVQRKAMQRQAAGKVAVPALRGRVFPPEVAEQLNQFFGDSAAGWLNAINRANDYGRMALTGFDFGAGMIQGIPLLAMNPLGWIRTQTLALRSLLNPRVAEVHKVKNAATFQDMAQHGIPISRAEQVVATEAGGVLAPGSLLSRRVPFIGPTIVAAAQRAAVAFNTFGDAARHELWVALKPRALATGRGEAALKELADFVSKATGVLPNSRLGIRATQAQIERGVFFAPRYYRAAIGLMADVFQGNLRGALARDAMGSMLGAGALFHYGWATALGQEPNLDPSKSDFLTVDIFDQKVGFGSIWTQMARLAGQTYKTVDDGDAESLLTLNPAENPLARFPRYRLSPVSGFGFDIVTGKDAIGRPIGDPMHQPMELARSLTRRALPIALQDIADFIPSDSELEDRSQPAVGVPAELFGLRSFPTSVFERKELLQDELGQSFFGKPWEELEPRQKRDIQQDNEELKHLYAQASAWQLERGDDLQVQINGYFDEQQAIRDEYSETLEKAQTAFDAGIGDGKRFRDAVEQAGQRIGTRYQILTSSTGPFSAAYEELSTRWNAESTEPQPIVDIFTDEYRERITVGTDEPEGVLHDAFGQYDFAERERRIEDIRAKLLERLNGDENARDDVWHMIMLRVQSAVDIPPLLQELRDGRDIFEAYFTAGDRIASQYNVLELYRDYKQLGALAAADEMKKTNPLLRRVDTEVSRTRLAMRRKSPALDAFLIKFAYASVPRNPTTIRLTKPTIQRSYSLELPLQ